MPAMIFERRLLTRDRGFGFLQKFWSIPWSFVLLLGGRHKGEPYTGLIGGIRRSVKKVIAFGEAGPEVKARALAVDLGNGKARLLAHLGVVAALDGLLNGWTR